MSNKRDKPILSDDGRNLEAINPDLYWENEELRARLEVINEENFKTIKAFEASEPRQIVPVRFTKFRALSPELRDMVWDVVVSNSGRVVEFAASTTNGRNRFYSKTGVPTIMMVNHEARKRALVAYTCLEFGKLSGTTYINWKLDTVLFKQDAIKVFMTEIAADSQMGRDAPLHEKDSIATRASKTTIHQQINRNCQELGVGSLCLSTLQEIYVSGLHFRNLKHLTYFFGFNRRPSRLISILFANEVVEEADDHDNRIAVSSKDTVHIETEDTSQLSARLQDALRYLTPQLQYVSVVRASRTEVKLLTEPEKEMRKRVRLLEAKERVKHAKRLAKMNAGVVAHSMEVVQHNVAQNLVDDKDEGEEECDEDGDQEFLDGEGEGGEDGEFFDEDALARELELDD